MGAWTADFKDVFDTMFGMDSSGGSEETITLKLRDAGDEDGQTADDVEAWGQGCILYRPKAPDAEGKAQVLTAQVGPRKIAIASRDSRATKTFGAVNAGDAVFGSPTGGGMFRANDDGSASMRVVGEGGVQKGWISIETDGTILIGNKWGHLELGENGFSVCLCDGPDYFQVKPGEIVCSSSKVNLAAAAVALGLGAVLPLAAVPTVPPGGFACASPVSSVTVRPG